MPRIFQLINHSCIISLLIFNAYYNIFHALLTMDNHYYPIRALYRVNSWTKHKKYKVESVRLMTDTDVTEINQLSKNKCKQGFVL